MILFIGFLLLGCSNKTPLATKSINSVESKTMETIEGNYTLREGRFSYHENGISIDKVVNASKLVIEKLDDDDYGYYFTMQVENLTPTLESGILHKDGDDYYNRLIYLSDVTKDSNITIDSNVSDDHIKTEIKDKAEVTLTDGNTLKIAMKLRDGNIIIIWDRDFNSEDFQTKDIKDAKHDYEGTFKERFLKYFKDI
jgi:hypothetical protein